MKITIVGTGYVGLSLAVLLARYHEVRALDVVQSKVDMINSGKSPIKEEEIDKLLSQKGLLNLTATTDKELAYSDTELVIIATPTNYNEETRYFDVSTVNAVIKDAISYNVPIIIKSTIPVGFVDRAREEFNYKDIYFSPEFLREGRSLLDNLHPSRIVVGDKGEVGKMFSKLLADAAIKEDIPILLTNPTEAEAIKLFANTYLAMRVAYFNELDSYAMKNNLNTKDIIDGICFDPRIGQGYNNPSFGYSGYCLPKDTKQLKANFENTDVAEDLITAIVNSNVTRKVTILKDIASKGKNKIGIYKTAMKAGSDNNRSSSILDIIKYLKVCGHNVIIYEPYNDVSFLKCEVENDFKKFVEECDLIVTNRFEEELLPYKDKVYTRDIFNEN